MTVNDEAEFEHARDTVLDLFGPDRWVDMANPELGSEDMAVVLEHVPGAYLNLSACATGDPEMADDNHSPRAAFDDSVVADGAAYLAEVALRRLAALAPPPPPPHPPTHRNTHRWVATPRDRIPVCAR